MPGNNRASKRLPVEIDGMIYDRQGKQLAQCMLRNVSAGGAQLELVQEIDIPKDFVLSLSREGHVKRNCERVWQFATVLGVKFTIKETI
jgi:hypothetical protein